MFVFVAAVLLASVPAQNAEVAPAEPLKAAVWVQPVITGLTAFGPSRYIAAGTNVSWGERRTFGVELGYFREHRTKTWEAFWEYDYLFITAGPAYQLTTGEPMRGWFVQPKVMVALLRSRTGFVRPGDGVTVRDDRAFGVAAEVGLDVGYHLRFGNFYLAPVIGASAGPGYNVPVDSPMLLPMLLSAPVGHAFKFDLNLNLLRVGAVF